MPLNSIKIKSIIKSTAFQEECFAILSFAAEVCEIPKAVLSFVENNSTTIIAQTEKDLIITKENSDWLNAKIILENETQTQSEPTFYMGIPIVFGNATTNGTLCFWDSKPRTINATQLKIINHIANEIQRLHQLQEQFSESEQKELYKKILDRLPTEIAVFDSNHRYLYVNPAAIQNEELRQYIIGKDDFEYAEHTGRDPQFAQERRNRFIEAAKSNSVIEWIDEIKKNDGSTSIHTRKYAPVFGEDKSFEMMVGFGVDITLQKKAEAALKISNERFIYASQASSDALWDWNMQTDEIFVGESYSTLFGHQFENNIITAAECENFIHPEDRENYFNHFDAILESNSTKWSDEYRYLKSDGSYAYVSDKAIIIRDINGKAIRMIGAMEDITERKNVEKQNRLLIEENNRNKNIQLNEAKNMYRLLADNTVDLVCLHNLDTTFEYVSPSIVKLMGYSPEELIGESPMLFVHPKDLELLQERFESFITKADDSYVEARFKNKNNEYVWFEIKASIVMVNGEPVSFQSSARDITQKKQVQNAMEKALIQERELNELRTNLVSTISHEFRTPMTTIRTSAELIEMYIEGHNFVHSAQLQKRINTITEEIDRIVELMNAVLTISKDDAGKTNFNPITFDLKQRCLDVIETSFSHQISGRKVQFNFKGNNFTVFADKNLMEYSLFNLLNNAFKYSEGAGDILLNLSSKNNEIEIQIIDFGIGIPEKDIPKLFNTFFRASNTEGIQGTGLGLYIVKTFTERNSGSIQVTSELGKGTQVTLTFPLFKS